MCIEPDRKRELVALLSPEFITSGRFAGRNMDWHASREHRRWSWHGASQACLQPLDHSVNLDLRTPKNRSERFYFERCANIQANNTHHRQPKLLGPHFFSSLARETRRFPRLSWKDCIG
jgi:hypothetical protein